MNKFKGIYLIVGESGSGKSSIVESLQQLNRQYTSLESYTTRPKRYPNEIGHTFITEEEFDNLRDICAYVKYNGYRYCATSDQVDKAVLYIIDTKGIEYFKKNYVGNKTAYIIYIKVPIYIRVYRMLKRGDGIVKTLKRLSVDIRQFRGIEKKSDCVIHNKDIIHSMYQLRSFILDKEQYAE